MAAEIEVSICIPAYKNLAFTKRLLDSIAEQQYTNYEIVVSDDSPGDEIEQLLKEYHFIQPVRYFRNQPAKGTPENWNEAIRNAQGKWIKIMHNDDWFNGPGALGNFMRAVDRHPQCEFFFSAFQNIIEGTDRKEVWRCNFFDRLFLRMNPLHLFKRVYVGNPSCTLVKNGGELYDNRFKFVVDFEYYIRLIKKGYRYKYIGDLCLNIGFHDAQVTKYTFLVADVQIPENFVLLGKLGKRILRNPIVYDYFWRMFRNLGVNTPEQVRQYYPGKIPVAILKVMAFQKRVKPSLLKKGIISKFLMTISYLRSLFLPVSSAASNAGKAG